MTTLEQLQSIAYDEIVEWVNKKNTTLDLDALRELGVQIPTADDLWEERNKFLRKASK